MRILALVLAITFCLGNGKPEGELSRQMDELIELLKEARKGRRTIHIFAAAMFGGFAVMGVYELLCGDKSLKECRHHRKKFKEIPECVKRKWDKNENILDCYDF